MRAWLVGWVAVLAATGATGATQPTEAALEAARADLRLGRIEAAIEGLSAAAKADPASAAVHLWLGNAHGMAAQKAGGLGALGPIRRARQSWEKALKLDPQLIDAHLSLATFYATAPGLAGGDAERAAVHIARAIEIDPYRGQLFAGSVHLRKKRWTEAEQALRAASALRPEASQPLIQLGVLLADSGRADEAFGHFEALVAADPHRRLALYQIGRTAAVTGQRAEAGLAALDAYLEAGEPAEDEPTFAFAQARRGQILVRAGRRDEARAAFERALALDPDNPLARAGIDDL